MRLKRSTKLKKGSFCLVTPPKSGTKPPFGRLSEAAIVSQNAGAIWILDSNICAWCADLRATRRSLSQPEFYTWTQGSRLGRGERRQNTCDRWQPSLYQRSPTGRYRSGQTGRTVNPLAYAFSGSNPLLPIPSMNLNYLGKSRTDPKTASRNSTQTNALKRSLFANFASTKSERESCMRAKDS